MFVASRGIAILSNLDMQQCPKMFCNFVQKVLAKNNADRFKQVNDIYGHIFGDRVLTRISEIITKCINENDLNCRYGGEEFIVFLPYADCSAAQIVANRIMEEIRSTQFDLYADFKLSVSIGISCGVATQEQCLNDIINSADKAMYQAKQNGRNQIAQIYR